MELVIELLNIESRYSEDSIVDATASAIMFMTNSGHLEIRKHKNGFLYGTWTFDGRALRDKIDQIESVVWVSSKYMHNNDMILNAKGKQKK